MPALNFLCLEACLIGQPKYSRGCVALLSGADHSVMYLMQSYLDPAVE